MRNTRRAEAGTGPGPRGNFTPPQRPAAASAAPQAPAAVELPGSGGRLSMRNWRVATRLNAILLIPVLVALVFGGFRVKSSVDTWQQADDQVRIADLVRAAATYSDAIEDERDVTVVPLLAGKREASQVTAAYARTDAAARAYHDAAAHVPGEADLKRRMQNFATVEPQLPSLRKAAYTKQLSGVQTEEWYVRIQHPLMELANELGFGTDNGAAYGRTLYAISLAKAAESLTRSIGTHILVERAKADEIGRQKTSLGSYAYLENIALEEYAGGGTPQDAARLKAARAQAAQKGQDAITAAQHKAESAHQAYVVPPDLTAMVTLIADPRTTPAELRAQGVTEQAYMTASTLSFNAYRSVEVALADQAARDASHVAATAKRDALVNSAVVLVALILAFIVAALMARAMSRSMRRLRSAAFDIAETRLPSLVDQLSRTDPGRVDTIVAPIPITSRDEIGEVARAFDQVHREAVRLAAEQALLRGNVNAIFTNLSQRNQGLIQRQLTLITELENNEADPEQLANLFKMDHLATRMRRNGENLLVLAGEEPGRQWNQPVPLVDVLRAAASEVEQYGRIELVGIPDTDIHGSAVTDLVHLLAELLENATTFSSPHTKVRVTATRLPDGRVMIEIHDRGIGLTAEDFADINHKLADPPTIDVEVARRMGLFVVGRLSDRHGIRVQLRPSGEQAGTTSLVMLPEPITHGGGGEEFAEGEGDFTVSRIVPEQPEVEAGPVRRPVLDHRSAAELGFDDSRYEQDGEEPAGASADTSAGAGALGPLGRSLHREERRAHLEAAAAAGQEPEPVLPHQRQEPQDYPQEYTAPEPFTPFGDQRDGYQQQDGYDGQPGYDGQDPGSGSGYGSGQTGYGPGYPQDGYQGQDFGQQPYQAQPQPQPQPQNGFAAADFGAADATGSGSYQEPAAYPEQGGGHPDGSGYDGQPYPGGDPYRSYDGAGYPGGYQDPYLGYPAAPAAGSVPAQDEWPAAEPQVTESVTPLPEQPAESVVSPSLTDAGLPRRDRRHDAGPQTSPQPEPRPEPRRQPPADRDQPGHEPAGPAAPAASGPAVAEQPDPLAQADPEAPSPSPSTPTDPPQSGEDSAGWRSTNDEYWQRAEQVREPKAGGVTPSGLPRRVPRANLVPGAATQTPQGGPQVSRAPEDVRGRLSNLRRGVQQGRTAGTDTNGQATDSRFGGPQNQER